MLKRQPSNPGKVKLAVIAKKSDEVLPSQVVKYDVNRVKELVRQLTDAYDGDFILTYLEDLGRQLQSRDGDIEKDIQESVRKQIVRRLNFNPNVTTAAVKCLKFLANKISFEELTVVVLDLAKLIVDVSTADKEGKAPGGKDRPIDVIAQGLQSVIANMDPNRGKKALSPIVPLMVSGVAGGLKNAKGVLVNDPKMQELCLDVLSDIFATWGSELEEFHESALNATVPLLQHAKDTLRDRAINSIGPLAAVLSDSLFASLMESLLKGIDTASAVTYINGLATVSKYAGVKVGNYLSRIVPKLDSMLKAGLRDQDASADKVDTLESCISTLKELTDQCPTAIGGFKSIIIDTGIQYLKFDPNFVGETQAMDDAGATGDCEWCDGVGCEECTGAAAGKPEQKSDAAFDAAFGDVSAPLAADSSDTSWKLRLAAVQLIHSYVNMLSGILRDDYALLLQSVIDRFSERDMVVRAVLFEAARALIRESRVKGKFVESGEERALDDDDFPAAPKLQRTRSLKQILDGNIEAIVQVAQTCYASGNLECKKEVLLLLYESLVTFRDAPVFAWDALVPCLLDGLSRQPNTDDDASQEALQFLSLALHFHAQALLPFLPQLAPRIIALICGKSKTKVSAIEVTRPIAEALVNAQGGADIVQALFQAVFDQLAQQDISENIKTASLLAVGNLYSRHPAVLKAQLPRVQPVLADRLNSEAARESALVCITKIASSADGAVPALVAAALPDITSFLRKNPKTLRHRAARALAALARSNGATFTPAQWQAAVAELSAQIASDDGLMSHLVLDALVVFLTSAPSTAPLVAQVALPTAVQYASNQFLTEGPTLDALVQFLQTCVERRVVKSPSDLLAQLRGTCTDKLSQAQLRTIAKCIAGVVNNMPDAAPVVSGFMKDIAGSPLAASLALLVLGELGSLRDLSAFAGLEASVFGAFTSKEAGVREAASFALGNVAVGNLDKYLPYLFSVVGSNPALTYLILNSLKELISAHLKTPQRKEVFKPHVASVLPVLAAQAKAELIKESGSPQASPSAAAGRAGGAGTAASGTGSDEGVRTIVAECLGRLLVVDVNTTLSVIEQFFQPGQPHLLQVLAAKSLRCAFLPAMDAAGYQRIGICLEANLEHLLTASPEESRCVAEMTRLRAESAALAADIKAKDVLIAKAVDAAAKAPLKTELDKLNERKDQNARDMGVVTVAHAPLRNIRREFVTTLTALIRAHVSALRHDTFTRVLVPRLYKELLVEKALVYEKDYGAFKQRVDDGLALRAACYECLAAVLDTAPNYLDMPRFIDELKKGFSELDAESGSLDLFTFTCALYTKLAHSESKLMCEVLKSLDPPLLTAYRELKKPYEGMKAPGQQTAMEPKQIVVAAAGEKNLEALRTLINLVLALHRMPGAAKIAGTCSFNYAAMQKTPLLKALLDDKEKASG